MSGRTERSPERVAWRRRWAVGLAPLVFFALLTVVHTWPLASDPATLIYDNADVELNAWIVSWVAHQLPRDPAHLFDANIFYPDRRALAFSEPLLPPGVLAIAPRALGASAVLTYNILLMAGFLLTALAGFIVGRRLWGDRMAGLLAGSLVAFGPHTLNRIAHLQVQWLVTLPLCLLAVDALIRKGSWRAGLGLGTCVALLAVTSGYGLTISLVGLAAAFLARTREWWRRGRQVVSRLAGGALLAVVLASPVLVTYWRVIDETGLRRGRHDVPSGLKLLTSFALTDSRLHYDLWSHWFAGNQGGTYFPGFTALALAVYALARAPGWRDPRARMLVAVVVAGVVVSLGPTTPLYNLLLAVFPPARAIRNITRFGTLVVLGVGLLAAMGLATLRRRLTGPARLLVPLVLIASAHAEVLHAPYYFAPYRGVSPVYARLAIEPHRVALAEFPFYSRGADYRNARYMLSSTTHWTPLVNGYSGFATRAYQQRADILKRFPDPEAVRELRRLGVSHVIVHPARARTARRRARVLRFLDSWRDVELLATGPAGERLYRISYPQR